MLTCCQAEQSRLLYFFDDFLKVRQKGLNAISPYAWWGLSELPTKWENYIYIY
jgi:hypothetical protein